MTNQEYIQKVARLKEIEEIVKNPESSLDKIDDLIEETKQIVTSCYGYTRGLKSKVELLNKVNMNDLEEDDEMPQHQAIGYNSSSIPQAPTYRAPSTPRYTPDDDPDNLPF